MSKQPPSKYRPIPGTGSGSELNRPKDWQVFQRVIRDIYASILGNADVDQFGREGQKQDGIDIIGIDSANGDRVGVQCKGRNDAHFNRHKAVTRKEFLAEVGAALQLDPPIDRFVLVTTGPNDTKLQQLAAELTQQHKAKNQFSVEFHAWDWVEGELKNDELKIAVNHGLIALAEKNGDTSSPPLPHIAPPQIPQRTSPARSTVVDEEYQPIFALVEEAAKVQGASRSGDQLICGDVTLDLALFSNYLVCLKAASRFQYLGSILSDQDFQFPLESMYFRLDLAQEINVFDDNRVSPATSLATLLAERRAMRWQQAKSLDMLLDEGKPVNYLVYGDPGGGKSSMQKWIVRQILNGRFARWQLPFFISLREYADLKQRFPELITGPIAVLALQIFAAWFDRNALNGDSSIHPGIFQTNADLQKQLSIVIGLLTRLSQHNEHVLLLFDGLDEISANLDVVNDVINDIKSMFNACSWIVTSRKTGYVQGLNPGTILNLVELRDEEIEQFVQNQAHFYHRSIDWAQQLTNTLLDNRRLSETARNPFFLTMICQLHKDSDIAHIKLRAKLRYRHAVYRDLVSQAQENWLKKWPKLPNHALAVESFDAFCSYLYVGATDAPKQLFMNADWLKFLSHSEKYQQFPLLDNHPLVSSRLITRIGQNERYHLVHLTIHEYLVASHLTALPASERLTILRRELYNPSWKMIIQFVVSELAAKRQRQELASIFQLLTTKPDLYGYTLLFLTDLYIEAGLEENDPLCENHTEELIQLWQSQDHQRGELAAAALARWNPTFAKQAFQRIASRYLKPAAPTAMTDERALLQAAELFADAYKEKEQGTQLLTEFLLKAIANGLAESVIEIFFITLVKFADKRALAALFSHLAPEKSDAAHQVKCMLASHLDDANCANWLVQEVNEAIHLNDHGKAMRAFASCRRYQIDGITLKKWLTEVHASNSVHAIELILKLSNALIENHPKLARTLLNNCSNFICPDEADLALRCALWSDEFDQDAISASLKNCDQQSQQLLQAMLSHKKKLPWSSALLSALIWVSTNYTASTAMQILGVKALTYFINDHRDNIIGVTSNDVGINVVNAFSASAESDDLDLRACGLEGLIAMQVLEPPDNLPNLFELTSGPSRIAAAAIQLLGLQYHMRPQELDQLCLLFEQRRNQEKIIESLANTLAKHSLKRLHQFKHMTVVNTKLKRLCKETGRLFFDDGFTSSDGVFQSIDAQ